MVSAARLMPPQKVRNQHHNNEFSDATDLKAPAMNSLEGRVVLISGTGGGLGQGTALRFAAAGARVVGCDINVERSREALDIVRSQDGEMISVEPIDVADPAQAERWIGAAMAKWNAIDVLCNNAGSVRLRGWTTQHSRIGTSRSAMN